MNGPYGQPGNPYPNGQPSYPQHSAPVSAPGGGYEQTPGHVSPPGYPAAPGYPPHTPPPPPKRFTGPLIGLVILAVVSAIGIVTLLVVNLSGDDDPQTTASPSPSESDEPTSEEPTTLSTTEEATQGTPAERISESEFSDWDYSFGGTDFFATKINGWDYDDCNETDASGTLAEYGCFWATEVAYEAEDGNLQLSVIYLGLPDDSSAGDLASILTDSDFNLNEESYIHDFDFGRWISESSSSWVVLTTGTATDAVDDDLAQEYLDTLHTDVTLALSFRL